MRDAKIPPKKHKKPIRQQLPNEKKPVKEQTKVEQPEAPENFESIRITLSKEAFEELKMLMETYHSRSHSATIEDCIMSVRDVMDEIWTLVEFGVKVEKRASAEEQVLALGKIGALMQRFTGTPILPPEKKQ